MFKPGDLVRHVYDTKLTGIVLEESASDTVVIYRIMWLSEEPDSAPWVYFYCLEKLSGQEGPIDKF